METFKRMINAKIGIPTECQESSGEFHLGLLGEESVGLALTWGNTLPILQYPFKDLCIASTSLFELQLISSGFLLSFTKVYWLCYLLLSFLIIITICYFFHSFSLGSFGVLLLLILAGRMMESEQLDSSLIIHELPPIFPSLWWT